jgi:hypothetical protein
MSGAESFVNAIQYSDGQDSEMINGAVVTGINLDGTVDLNYLGQIHPGIECLSSYTNRIAGDLVMVRSSGSRWTVLGSVGAAPPSISWGTGSPVGGDWETAASVKVRPGQLYVQGTAFAAENYIPTPQALITMSSDRAFQAGIWDHQFSGRPAQGVDSSGMYGTGVWAGGWFYGSDISTAAAAKTVKRMELRIERGAEPLGLDEPIIPLVYVHNTSSAPATEPAVVSGPYRGTALEIGQSAWWQLPDEVIALFVANSVKGFLIKADTPEEFMVMAEYAGDVRITN